MCGEAGRHERPSTQYGYSTRLSQPLTLRTVRKAYLSDGLHLVSYDSVKRLNDCLGILVMGPRHHAGHFRVFKLGGPAGALC